MLTDIEIAAQAKMKRITDVAAAMGIRPEELEPYGHYKAKLSDDLLTRLQDRPDGKLVLVTAVNPTPAGEGKTTVSIGLGQAMCKLGKNAVIALREPSLGPVFGIKGGAAGGGYSQVVPMEDINLHFTGDLHAITSANNLMCALLDNHIQQGNVLGIDPRRVQVKRCMDMNDRALRNIICSLGGTLNGVPREDHFCITVASEVMAILCLAENLQDLKKRLGDILVAYTYDGAPVYARDIQANGAMTVLLKDAIKPNLVQTLENTPAIMHGGPFANIAHGCNSVRATKTALKLGDYAITEAGFGSDLGAEKFFDIKCRYAGLTPACVVLVSTVRSMKYNGGVPKDQLKEENLDALRAGSVNLLAHIENLKKFGVPVVVAGEIEDIDSYRNIFCIRRNHVQSGFLKMDAVIAAGHRHIGIIPNELPTTIASRSCLRGMKDAVRRRKMRWSDIAKPVKIMENWGSSMKCAYDQTLEVMRNHPEVTALVVDTASGAAGALRALADLKLRCPEDVSIVTAFSDTVQAEFTCPRLTAVSGSTAEVMIDAAMKIIFTPGEVGSRVMLLDVELIERESLRRL